jgi:hypothetical protein
MSLSVKDTAEIVLAVARLLDDGDIILQRDGFTREAVIRIIISQTISEGVPIVLAFDLILALQRKGVLRVSVYVTRIVLIIVCKIQAYGYVIRIPVRWYRNVWFR